MPDLNDLKRQGQPLVDLDHATEPIPAWPEIRPLDASGRDLPPFPVDALGPPLVDFVTELAVYTQTPTDLPGLAVIGALSTATSGRIRVKAGWTEPAHLWTCSVQPPGMRKSAVFTAVFGLMHEWESEAADKISPAREAAIAKEVALRAEIKRLGKEALKAKEGAAETLADLQATLTALVVPAVPAAITGDFTPEALGQLIADQGGRMAVVSAEGGEVFAAPRRYSEGTNMEILLKGHASDPVRIHRLSRPSLRINRPCLTIAVTAQPDVVSAVMADAMFRGRGLPDRYIFGMSPATLGERELDPPAVSRRSEAAYRQCVMAVLKKCRPLENSVVLDLSAGAASAFREWRRTHEPRLAAGSDLGEISGWGSKLPGAGLRLAGLLHVARYPDLSNLRISEGTLRDALTMCDWAIPHALEAFGVVPQEIADAGKVLGWCRGRTDFAQADCWRAVRRGLKEDRPRLDDALRVLVDRGHLRARPVEYQGRGRPALPHFDVNPACRGT